MNTRHATYLLVAVFAAACQPAPLANDGDPIPGEGAIIQLPSAPFPLAIGASAHSASGSVEVTLVSVLEDSRCPSDVVCVWEGRVKVLVRVDPAGSDPSTIVLTLPGTETDPASGTAGGYRVTLHAIDPYPVSTGSIELDEYRATLTVEPAA